MNRNGDRNHEMLDVGPEPFVFNIERLTLFNTNYRAALWTGQFMQLTVMSIPVSGEIGLEMHPDHDQFLMVEGGVGEILMGETENRMNIQAYVSPGYAIIIPAGIWHNLVNNGNRPLKLFSIYAPPAHPRGTIHETKAIADREEEERY